MTIGRRLLITAGAGAALAGTARAEPALGQAGASTLAVRDGLVHLPARVIGPPTSISEAARAYLRRGADISYASPPPAADADAWRRMVADQNAALLKMTGGGEVVLPGFAVETRIIGGVTVYVVTPKDAAPERCKPHLSVHGGGWTGFGGKVARLLAQVQAQRYGGTVYGVDYRTPPDHPFPAPLDDCLAVYRELVKMHPPGELLVAGSSAGANLAAALMLKARDAGLPPPRALVLETLFADATCSGDTLQTNQYVDTLLKVWSKDANVAVYAHGADLNDPYLSPLKGDLSRGFPPTYLRSGTRDLFLSDTVRFHAALRKAGVEADLYIGEAMPHGGFGARTPEDEDARQDALRWLAKNWL
ncbi:alpha/beta hydrolase fold domain-containing protein [Caulobacter sp. LARHSG274]